MKTGRALLAGLAGAVAMSLVLWVARILGAGASLEMLLGSVVSDTGDTTTWLIGFGLHLMIGAVMALLYMYGFEYAVQRAGIAVGGAFGIAHGLMAGLFMSAIPAMNPLSSNAVANAPGAFFSYVPYGPLLFLLAHFVYGAMVGLFYGRTEHKVHQHRTA